jgi:hypothetical protein
MADNRYLPDIKVSHSQGNLLSQMPTQVSQNSYLSPQTDYLKYPAQMSRNVRRETGEELGRVSSKSVQESGESWERLF